MKVQFSMLISLNYVNTTNIIIWYTQNIFFGTRSSKLLQIAYAFIKYKNLELVYCTYYVIM